MGSYFSTNLWSQRLSSFFEHLHFSNEFWFGYFYKSWQYMPVNDWWLTFHNGLKPSWNHEMFFKIYLARDGERTLQDTIMNTVYRKQLNTNPLWLYPSDSIRKDFTPLCFVLLPSSWWFAQLAKLLNASSTTVYSTTFLYHIGLKLIMKEHSYLFFESVFLLDISSILLLWK